MAHETAANAGDFCFSVNAAPGWSVVETETSEPAEAGKAIAMWSLLLAVKDGTDSRRLGMFISLDPETLFKQREWAMAFEQEIARARHHASRFLKNHRKPAGMTPR